MKADETLDVLGGLAAGTIRAPEDGPPRGAGPTELGDLPVLVLAILWPQLWGDLTARPPYYAPDPHAQARELLVGLDITVPATFTAAQVKLTDETRDPQLARACKARISM